MKNIHYIFLTFILLHSYGCTKFIEVSPPIDQITSQTVFDTDATAVATVNGIYSQMMVNSIPFTSSSTSLYTGLYADELYNYGVGTKNEFTASKLTIATHSLLQSNFWLPAYNFIYTANLAVEGLEKSNSLTPSVKQSLTGEAKFIRAFCYFYLVNLFGDVPLITETNYLLTKDIPRTEKQFIYNQIIQDLKDAQQLLPTSYTANEKNKPTKWAATSLLARTYLYNKDWIKAENESSAVINSGKFNLLPNLRQVFLKNSAEAIWQLQPVQPSFNTVEAREILPTSAASLPTYIMTQDLVNSFDSADKRKKDWDTVRTYLGEKYHLPYKYKVVLSNTPLTEYYTVLRLAEQYLIRAEARAHLSKITEAAGDLNKIRNRAGLSNTTATTPADMLLAIEQERRLELFAEWGHRFLDLKRTGRINTVLGNLKPGWLPTAALWPIPETQINLNPKLTQNPGY